MSYVSIPSAQEQQKQQELQAQQVVAQLYVDQEEPELPHETEQYAEEEEVEYNLAHPMIYGQYGQAARPYAARHAYVPHVEPYEKPYEPVEHYADVPVKQPYEEQKEHDVVVEKEQSVEAAAVSGEQVVEQIAEPVLKLVALPVKPELAVELAVEQTVEQSVEQNVEEQPEEQPMNVDVVKQTDPLVDAPAKPTLTLIALPVKESAEKPEDIEQEQPTVAAIRVQLPVPEEDYEVPDHVEMCDIASLQQQVEETLAHAVNTVVEREKGEQDVQEIPVVEETAAVEMIQEEEQEKTAVEMQEEHTAAEETAIEDEQTEEIEEDSFVIDTMFGKLLKQLEQIELNHLQKRGEWAAERAVWQAEKMLLEKRLDKEIERRTKAESELAALNKLVDLDLEWKEQPETAPLSDTLTQEMIKEIQEIEL